MTVLLQSRAFGLKNAKVTYQHMVHMMFVKQIGHNMEVYVDDMLINSKQVSSHVADQAEDFNVPQRYQMKLNSTKYAYVVASLKLLDFMVHQ